MTARPVTTVVPGSVAEAGAVRRWLADVLGAGHPAADTAVLLLSEVFANACLHSRSGRPGGTVAIHAVATDHAVRIEVVDEGGGPAPAAPGDPGPDAENGRGLWLLDALAKEWATEDLPDGRLRIRFIAEG